MRTWGWAGGNLGCSSDWKGLGATRAGCTLGKFPRISEGFRTVPVLSVGTFRRNAVCNLTKLGERWPFPSADQSRTSLLLTVLKLLFLGAPPTCRRP